MVHPLVSPDVSPAVGLVVGHLVAHVLSPVVCALLGGSGRCGRASADVTRPRAVLLRAWPAQRIP
jgi:hypothetical protein